MGDNLTDLELAWLAGFIDGEGYIGINTKGKNSNGDIKYQLTLRIFNTHQHTMNKIAMMFGKNSVKILRSTKNKNWRDQYYVAIYDREAESILSKLVEYLITKKQQAINALEFRKTIMKGRNQWDRISDYAEIKLLQFNFYQYMKQLNERGGKAA